ncbi:MAG: hypothetical protein J6A38_00750 [Clostridia bacterium]|nr:hypothetical protein [Clostridia bacterium]
MTIEQVTMLINVFFTPFITLFLLYKKDRERVSRLEIVMKYAVITVFVALCSEAVATVAGYLFDREINAYGSYYTVIAVAFAVLFGYFASTNRFGVKLGKKDKGTTKENETEQTTEKK